MPPSPAIAFHALPCERTPATVCALRPNGGIMVTPVLHVLPLTIRSAYLQSLLFCCVLSGTWMKSGGVTSPSCTRLFCRDQRHFFPRLRRAERFSSSSPAAGLGRAIFEASFSWPFSVHETQSAERSIGSSSSSSDGLGRAAGVVSARRPTPGAACAWPWGGYPLASGIEITSVFTGLNWRRSPRPCALLRP